MLPNPNPDKVIAIFQGKSPMMGPCANGPEFANLFEM
jgi:hypothetical protein